MLTLFYCVVDTVRTSHIDVMACGGAVSLDVDEKVKIIKLYYANGENAGETRRLLYQEGVVSGRWKEIGVSNVPIHSACSIISIAKK